MAWTARIAAAVMLGVASTAVAQSPALADGTRTDSLGDSLPPGAIMRLGSVRWRPGGSIEYLAFSPDARRLASWHEEHHTTAAFTLWDVATGRELRRIEIPRLSIFSWTWLADGRGLAVVNTSDGPYVWEFSDEKMASPPHRVVGGPRGLKIAANPGPDYEHLSCFAVSPDGRYLAGGKSGTRPNKERDLLIWELATQRKVADLSKPRRLASCPESCWHVFFTPDSAKIVAFCPAKQLKGTATEYLVVVFDTATGKELRRFTSPAPLQQGPRMSAALSTRYLALGLEDEQGTVLLWDLDGQRDKRIVTGHKSKTPFSGYGVSAVVFTPDGKALITAGRDGAVRVWDIDTGKKARTLDNAYAGWIETLAVTRDGKRLACAGQEGMIRHWDLATGTELGAHPGHGGVVTGITVTADDTTAVTLCADKSLRIWDLATGRERRAIDLPGGALSWSRAKMSPDGRTVVASLAGQIKAWNVNTGKAVRLPEAFAESKAGESAFAANGETLLAFHADTVTLFDWPSGKLRRRLTLPKPAQKPGEAHCDAATLSPNGRWLATCAHRSWHYEERGLRFGYAADNVLDLWNAITGERVHRLVDSPWAGSKALFTPDGDLLFDGVGKLRPLIGDEISLTGELHLVDPVTGRLKQSFESAPELPGTFHRRNAAIGIAPDGRSIVCADNDGVLHIYETATGKIRRSLVRHRGYVGALAFTADGRRVLSASYDLTALVWDVSLRGLAPKRAAPLIPDEETKLWNTLRDSDAKAAYAAMAMLAAEPDRAVALIRAHIKAVAGSPDDATLDRLVAELGDKKFAVRERAARELEALGESAAAGMRARLAKSLPIETDARIVRFLHKHDPLALTPTRLREIRALEMLEQLNSPQSRAALTELAKGARNARLTQAAAASLARLDVRK